MSEVADSTGSELLPEAEGVSITCVGLGSAEVGVRVGKSRLGPSGADQRCPIWGMKTRARITTAVMSTPVMTKTRFRLEVPIYLLEQDEF